MSLFQFMEGVATVIPDKWKRVDVALRLSLAQVNGIDAQHWGDPLDCFAEVLCCSLVQLEKSIWLGAFKNTSLTIVVSSSVQLDCDSSQNIFLLHQSENMS